MFSNKVFFVFALVAAGCSVSNDEENIFGPEASPKDTAELAVDATDELAGRDDPTLDDDEMGILLLDTTDSMQTIRQATGNTRCDDAKIMARGIIYDFFDASIGNGDGIAIWGFTNPDGAPLSDDVQPTISGYYTDPTSAIAAVDALSCAGSTPLADAMCKGLNGDGETFTIDPLPDQVFILTDGLENNSNGPCSGPSGSITNPSTWQAKVIAEMNSTDIRIDTRYWLSPTVLAQLESIDSFAVEDGEVDPSIEELQIVAEIEGLAAAKLDQLIADMNDDPVALASGCDTTCKELKLMKAMANASNGTWGIVTDDDVHYPVEETVDPAQGPVHPELPDDDDSQEVQVAL